MSKPTLNRIANIQSGRRIGFEWGKRMNSSVKRVLAVGVFLSAQGAVAHASDTSGGFTTGVPQKQYVIHLGIGAQYQPKYPGADSYILTPLPIVAVDRLVPSGARPGGRRRGKDPRLGLLSGLFLYRKT